MLKILICICNIYPIEITLNLRHVINDDYERSVKLEWILDFFVPNPTATIITAGGKWLLKGKKGREGSSGANEQWKYVLVCCILLPLVILSNPFVVMETHLLRNIWQRDKFNSRKFPSLEVIKFRVFVKQKARKYEIGLLFYRIYLCHMLHIFSMFDNNKSRF